MTSTETSSDSSTPESALPAAGDMKLEVIVLPVSDVDRAKHFYQNLGWRLDSDLRPADDFRAVQFTPPGSLASIRFGTGIEDAAPDSVVNLTLAVQDLDATRSNLLALGVAVSDVFHGRGGFSHHTGAADRTPGPDPQRRSYFSFASFSDPDGNSWMLQEIKQRLPGR
jgi:catechol 2,3-dioxygenase-like lactoylglutathione lyase family enzyme